MEEIMIDASKLTYLENSKIFSLVISFLENLDSEKLDNIYYSLIEHIEEEKLDYVFDILSRVFYYISFLVNTIEPKVCSFKIIKHYISNGKILLKIKLKEL